MITFFLGLMAFVFMIAVYIMIGSVVILIFTAVFFFTSLFRYLRVKNLRASEMVCPNCGSTEIRIQSKATGTSTNAAGTVQSGFGLWGLGSTNTSYKFQREGICQNCGFNYSFFTPEEVSGTIRSAGRRLLISGILFAGALIMLVTMVRSETSDTTEAGRSGSAAESSENKSVWASEVTDIEEFDYYIDGEDLYLKEYEGKHKKVRIASSYEIGDKNYNVVGFSDAVFVFSDVTSVILPEGLTSMPSNTFNSSDIEFLYIPASLTDVDGSTPFYSYLHDCEKIYYGGSEDQWAELTDHTDRSEIDVKEIICNSSIDDLK